MSTSTDVGKYIGVLLSSREQAHVFHLLTTSYAEHKALQAYYEAIVPLIDTYAETYMGISKKKIRGLGPHVNKRILTDERLIRPYFARLVRILKKLKLPKYQFLLNISQEIDALIRQTMYMLKLH